MSTTAPMLELAATVANWREDAGVLARRGDTKAASILEQCAVDIERNGEEYTRWLTETEAQQRSGWSSEVVRRHARKFRHTPHVTFEKRQYRMRACIVPRRAHYEMIERDAERGAAA